MTLYAAMPKTSHDILVVATTAALKTVLQVATPATTDLRVVAWGISFKGVAVTDPPGEVSLLDANVAATVTSLTPEKWGSDDAPTSLCVGGASATGVSASAEGSITASRLLDPQLVHPQAGYSIWFPERARPLIQISRFLRIRTDFSVDISCVPWIVWEEPS